MISWNWLPDSASQLTKVILSHNKLEYLPDELFQLRSLQELNVKYNCVQLLPPVSKWMCEQLRVLNLSHNLLQLSGDPASVFRRWNLQNEVVVASAFLCQGRRSSCLDSGRLGHVFFFCVCKMVCKTAHGSAHGVMMVVCEVFPTLGLLVAVMACMMGSDFASLSCTAFSWIWTLL